MAGVRSASVDRSSLVLRVVHRYFRQEGAPLVIDDVFPGCRFTIGTNPQNTVVMHEASSKDGRPLPEYFTLFRRCGGRDLLHLADWMSGHLLFSNGLTSIPGVVRTRNISRVGDMYPIKLGDDCRNGTVCIADKAFTFFFLLAGVK